MPGPGEYVPDITEGITSVADLPPPRLERRSRNFPARRCPHCGRRAGRYSVASRTLHDLGDPRSGRPIDLVVTYSKHHCPYQHLFVRRHLTAAWKKVLARLVRGQPQLRALREIRDEVYRLFDRRCKTATAVRRLEKLRRRVRRFKRLARALGKLNSPTLDRSYAACESSILGLAR